MEIKDSFGVEVQVGDYLVFAVKSRYLSTLGIGRVTKISPKGSVSMMALKSYGKTLAEQRRDAEAFVERITAEYAARGEPLPAYWANHVEDNCAAYKTTLGSASTCYKIPAHAVPIDITQALHANS